MKLKFAICGLGLLALGGCAEATKIEQDIGIIYGSTVPSNVALLAEQTYDTATTGLEAYLLLPVCGTAPCHLKAAVDPINHAVLAGRGVRDQVHNLLLANPSAPIPIASYNTLKAAGDALTAIKAQYSIN